MSTASHRYKVAHDLHWKDGDLEAARTEYEAIIAEFPDSPEAGYSRTQIENIDGPEIDPEHAPLTLERLFARRFVCPVCHARRVVVRRIECKALGFAGQPLAGYPYLAVSCGECARTQFYDLSILEPDAEKVPQRL